MHLVLKNIANLGFGTCKTNLKYVKFVLVKTIFFKKKKKSLGIVFLLIWLILADVAKYECAELIHMAFN